MKKLLCLPYLLITLNLLAQDSTQRNHEIYWEWPRWRMADQKLSNQELKQEIFKVPEAVPYYKKAKTNKTISYSMIVPLTIFIVAGKEKDMTSPRYNQVKPGMALFTVSASVTAVYCMLRSGKQLKKAVRIRNEKLGFTY